MYECVCVCVCVCVDVRGGRMGKGMERERVCATDVTVC